MILFDGLPVPSTLFLFMCTCFPCIHVSLYIHLDTLCMKCIYEYMYDVVNVCILEQTFQDRYSNLLILLFFENIIL